MSLLTKGSWQLVLAVLETYGKLNFVPWVSAAGVGMLVQKGQPHNEQLLFLEPFEAKLWVTLLGVVFGAALIQKLLSLYTPFGDRSVTMPFAPRLCRPPWSPFMFSWFSYIIVWWSLIWPVKKIQPR